MDASIDEFDLESSPDQFGLREDHPTDFNDEILDPDVNNLFTNEHIRWGVETDQQYRERTESTAFAPPKPARYYSQDGNQPEVRSGSVGSAKASDASNSDACLLSSNDSPQDLDQDVGMLFTDSQPEIANTLADRQGRNRPSWLNLSQQSEDDSQQRVSSATFVKQLEALVVDPEVRGKLLNQFQELNKEKNQIALSTWKLYEQANGDNKELLKEYWSGPGHERRRIRLEQELEEQDKKKSRKQRRIQMALDEEARSARVAAIGDSEWKVHPETGNLKSPESDLNDIDVDSVDDDDDDDDDDSVKMSEMYSDEDEAEDDDERRYEKTSDNDDDWPGDRISRLPLSEELGRNAFSTGRLSAFDTDKPLPFIPGEESWQTLVDIQVLTRLLPIKIALIEQLQTARANKQTVLTACDRADETCTFAEENGATKELQGRCAFYMGLAEYMRSRINRDEREAIYEVAIMSFDNACTLCGDVYEEGAWGEEWALYLRRLQVDLEGDPQESSPNLPTPERKEREGADEKLMDGLMERLRRGGEAVLGSIMGNAVACDYESEDSSSFGRCFAIDKGQKLQRPDDVEEPEDSNEKLPSKKRPVGLGLQTDSLPVELKNTVLSPFHGLVESPERYANGLTRSPTTPTIDKFPDASVYSPDYTPSSHTQTPSKAPQGRYRIVKPDPPSIDSTASIEPDEAPPAPKSRYRILNPDLSSPDTPASRKTDEGLPAPVTISPSNSYGILSNLTRRLSSAISPTSDTSASNPKSPDKIPETPEEGEDAIEAESGGTKRLSIAERRRKSSTVHMLRSLIRGGDRAARSQDSLKEAEEGDSPLKANFDLNAEMAKSSGSKVKSPLSSSESGEGDEVRLRRRRSAGMGRTDEEMV